MNTNLVHNLGVVVCAGAGVFWLVIAMSAVGARRQRHKACRRLDVALGEVARAVSGPGEGTALPGQDAAVPGRGADPGQAVARRVVVRGAVYRWLSALGTVCAGFVLVGGVVGGLLGILGGAGVWWWQRRPAPHREFDEERAVRELPLAADLLAACIAAGAGPITAARVVGDSLGGPVGERLARGAAELRLGGEPSVAWRQLAALPKAAPLARLLERAGESGAPAAAPVARLAAEARAEWGRAASARARRAAVLITAPVGLCFLPAFIAVGVLPVVIGLAGGLLNGGGG